MAIHSTLILRVCLAVVLLMHSLPGMFDNGVNDFGNLYLNKAGFAPVGLPLAWAIKLSYVWCAVMLLRNKHLKLAGGIAIGVLSAGIAMVHAPNGWFVVGRGSNGVEFNVLLIAALLTCMFENGWNKKQAQ